MTVSIPSNLPSIARAKLPAIYSKARETLAACERIDECKDWADKAEALASYAKQAQDDGMRKMADRIQARAIRQAGKLLEEIEKATGAHRKREGARPLSRKRAARDAGLSDHQQKTALRVAKVPEEEFEEAVESDDPPTVTELARRGTSPAKSFDLAGRNPNDFATATNALGWVKESATFCRRTNVETVVAGILPRELRKRDKVIAEVEDITEWLRSFRTALKRAKE